MSEEQNFNNGNEPKSIKKLTYAVVLSLIFSILALILAVVVQLEITGQIQPPQKEQPAQTEITDKYDRGQSFAKAQTKDEPIVVFFYTNWCGFCQRFAPTYDKISKDSRVKNKVAFAYVNCEDQQNAGLVSEYKIQGYPSVFVVLKDGTRKQLDNGHFFNEDSVDTVVKDILDIID